MIVNIQSRHDGGRTSFLLKGLLRYCKLERDLERDPRGGGES
jgi:hypothetical protein